MNSENPKVSIVIPVYNGSNYLKKAIDSALNQTYKNIEVVVVNDGSNDHGATEAIALSYGDKIKYYSKENGGVASALNYAIEKMTGEYFSWLSHDDMYYPEKVEKQVAALAKLNDPNAVIACNVTVIDANDQKIKSNKIHSRANRSIRCFLATDTDTGLNGCALLVPKDLFTRFGNFNTNLKATQDYDLWFRFSFHTQFLILEDELVLSRSHDLQGSRNMGMLPTLEADNLHSRILSTVDIREMRKFVGTDQLYLMNAYRIFSNAGYPKTAARIYSAIIKLAFDLGDFDKGSLLLAKRLLSEEGNSPVIAEKFLYTLFSTLPENKKPTVLMYCNVWTRGGVERVLSVLFEELKHKYNFVLVSHVSTENFVGYPLPPEVTHIEIRPELGAEIPYILLLLADLSQASLVISNPNIIKDALKIYPVMKDCGIKSIAFNHYYYFLPTWSPWLYPVMAERLSYLKDATASTWLTSFNTNTYALNNSNGALMPNPNSFEIAEETSSHRSRNIILCVGRFYDSIKRLDRALKVFKHVIALNPDAQLVLVGGYNLDLKVPYTSPEPLKALFDRLDFPPGSVVFEGEQESVTEYYQKAAVLILVSDYEGFPLVLTEASTNGVPSVIFEVPGLEDLIADGVNGFIVQQDDFKGMAEKIAALLSDDTLRAMMGHNAREMSKRFDRKVVAERWSNLIDMVLETDDPQVLEQQLADCFMTPPTDMEAFTRTIAREYEKSLRTVISSGATPATQVTSVSTQAILSASPEADLALRATLLSLQAEHQSLHSEHQALQTAHQSLMQSNQELYENHKQLLAYYQDVMNSKPVRYTSKLKSLIKKLGGGNGRSGQ